VPGKKAGFALIALRAGASRVRTRFAVAATAFLVVVLLVAPAGVLASSVRLSNPTVTPRTSTTATTFTFGITYTNKQGSGAPNEIFVVIDGVNHTMVAQGSDWRNGVLFIFKTRLPAGTHTIAFHSLGRDRFVDDVAAGTVKVGAAPAPRPTSAPPPPANGGPTTTPSTAPSGPASGAGGSSGSSGSSGSGGSGVDRDYDSIGSSTSGGSGGSGLRVEGSRGGPGVGGTPAAGGDRFASYKPGATGAAGGGTGSGNGGSGWSDVAAFLKALSPGGTTTRTMPLMPSIIITAGTVAMLMTFMFFGKRRRDGEPPEADEVLSAAAARGAGVAATASLVPNVPVAPGIPDDEIGMPRWRRPSLLEARKNDPARSGIPVAAPLSFARSAMGPAGGRERRFIRYHVVGLLDVPDEFRGQEIGMLSRDDEVQLLERSGTYWRVLCPDGREGWIHKMTLGDVVGEPRSPSAAESWAATRPDVSDFDHDVLTAFMTSRARA
jgi:hypothetical protein